jgi:hypothetical protein
MTCVPIRIEIRQTVATVARQLAAHYRPTADPEGGSE